MQQKMSIPICVVLLGIMALLQKCNTQPGKIAKDSDSNKMALTIAAASDLKFAMDSIISVFQTIHPATTVSAIYGSSGKFYQQLANQAPFDLFFSADIEYARRLDQKGLTEGRPIVYAIGSIVLYSHKISTKKGMTCLLDDQINKIAIANPAHAPYGQRAEEALRFYKVYEQVKQKLVLGENVSQTAQYIGSGAAEIGIIALSLALSPALREKGNYFLIPGTAHRPLEQAYVIMKKAAENEAAGLFAEFMSAKQAKDILIKYGFTLPA